MRLRYFFVATAVLVGVALLLWPRNRPTAFPPLPQPNGYDALVRAAATLQLSGKSARVSSTEELAELNTQNQTALADLRDALKLPCAVPVQTTEGWGQTHLSDLTNLKTAALAWDAEIELHLRRGDSNAALGASIDLLQFSRAIHLGGILVDSLSGKACEALAISRIKNLIPSLNRNECNQLISALEGHQNLSETFEAIQIRDNEWARKTYGIAARIRMMIAYRSLKPGVVQPSIVTTYNSRLRESRLVLLQAAVRAYQLDHGRSPSIATDLVSSYLVKVPLDPDSDEPLELR